VTERIYRVRFTNEGRIFELYARNVNTSSVFGFVEVEGFVWGKKSEVILDPTEQELKNEFAAVKRTLIPLHAVLRVDEVEKSGSAKILPLAAGSQRSSIPDPLAVLRPPHAPKKD